MKRFYGRLRGNVHDLHQADRISHLDSNVPEKFPYACIYHLSLEVRPRILAMMTA